MVIGALMVAAGVTLLVEEVCASSPWFCSPLHVFALFIVVLFDCVICCQETKDPTATIRSFFISWATTHFVGLFLDWIVSEMDSFCSFCSHMFLLNWIVVLHIGIAKQVN
ncbi:MAG TPA: hypothetical protein V6C97_18510 [Oculatellaceae cyanobacterium]